MTISDFIKEIQFCSIDNDTELIKNSHPLQWLNLNIPVPLWKIKYKYTTNKGNNKEGIKYLIENESAEDCLDHYFQLEIDRYNEKYPYRQISNVEILDYKFIEGIELPLE